MKQVLRPAYKACELLITLPQPTKFAGLDQYHPLMAILLT